MKSFRLYPGMVLGEMAGLLPEESGLLFVVMLLNFSDGTAISRRDPRLRLPKLGWARIDRIIDGLIEGGNLIALEDGAIYAVVADRMLEESKADARPAIPTHVRRAVVERDGFVCVYCKGEDGPFEFDHRRPWSRGGDHSVENICISCRDCNRAKRALTDEEFSRG